MKEGILMKKIKKLISLLIITAVVFASTITCYAASCQTSYGMMSGNIGGYTSGTFKNLSANTFLQGTAPKITAQITIVDYYTGATLDNSGVQFNLNASSVTALADAKAERVSAFAAHQVIGTSSWAVYSTTTNI